MRGAIRELAIEKGYHATLTRGIVGHPAAVNPERKLADLARTYGWPVMSLESRDEVPRRPFLAS